MKITIQFSTDNAAFEDNPDEIASICRRAGMVIMCEWAMKGDWERQILDSNGNSVGTIRGEFGE